jgi:hypothetical protein
MEPPPYAIVGFLDFLGFREMVELDASSSAPTRLPKILEALGEVEARANESELELSQFSDSIILTSDFDLRRFPDLVRAVRDLQRLLVEREILIRGGVAFGRHYADQGRMFSHALVKAYLLETERAHVPRILIDPNLVDWAVNHKECDSSINDEFRSLLASDRDGEVFIDYLDADLLPDHERLINDLLKRGNEVGSASLISKAHWLIDYHEFVCGRLGKPGLSTALAARFEIFEPLGN